MQQLGCNDSYLHTITALNFIQPSHMPVLTGCPVASSTAQCWQARVSGDQQFQSVPDTSPASLLCSTASYTHRPHAVMLSRVHKFTQSGWPEQVIEGLKPFWHCCGELAVEAGCVLWAFVSLFQRSFINDFWRCYTNVTYCRNCVEENHSKELPVVARIGQRARAAS